MIRGLGLACTAMDEFGIGFMGANSHLLQDLSVSASDGSIYLALVFSFVRCHTCTISRSISAFL